MSKLRTPVIYEIEGTAFEVDVDKQVLRQTDDRSNELSFIKDMQDHDKFYRLLYDLDEKKAAEDLFNQNRVNVIDIPQMTELDPQGMAAKYGLFPEQVTGKSDFEVIVDPDLLERRLNGELPQINIAGETFVIDLKLQELRHAVHFFPVISLKSFELTDDGWHYEAYYHPVMKQVVELDPKLLELPEGVVKVKLPNEIGLDPVATAAAYGMDERALLRRYPIQKGLKAEVIPLSETDVPRLVRQNREHLQEEHRQVTQKSRPGTRPRF